MLDNAVAKRPTRIVFCLLHKNALPLYIAAKRALEQANASSMGALTTQTIDTLAAAVDAAKQDAERKETP